MAEDRLKIWETLFRRALATINPILRDRRAAVLAWLDTQDRNLREDFANLELIEYRRSYDHCASIVKEVLASSS